MDFHTSAAKTIGFPRSAPSQAINSWCFQKVGLKKLPTTNIIWMGSACHNGSHMRGWWAWKIHPYKWGQICYTALARIEAILWSPFQHTTPLRLGCQGHRPALGVNSAGEEGLLYRLRWQILRGCEPAAGMAFTSDQLLPLVGRLRPACAHQARGQE